MANVMDLPQSKISGHIDTGVECVHAEVDSAVHIAQVRQLDSIIDRWWLESYKII